MRHDVAYLGKVRKIVDSRGRDVINYRYDKLTGNVIRVRDMVGNDINFEYGQNGKLALITRRAANQDAPEPVRAFGYDQLNNLTDISTLNADGEAVVTTSLEYTRNREVASVSNGQTQSKISYNAFGYPVTVTNVFGQSTQRELDKFNRMISSTDFLQKSASIMQNELYWLSLPDPQFLQIRFTKPVHIPAEGSGKD
jgi:YD repeat-containing protein